MQVDAPACQASEAGIRAPERPPLLQKRHLKTLLKNPNEPTTPPKPQTGVLLVISKYARQGIIAI